MDSREGADKNSKNCQSYIFSRFKNGSRKISLNSAAKFMLPVSQFIHFPTLFSGAVRTPGGQVIFQNGHQMALQPRPPGLPAGFRLVQTPAGIQRGVLPQGVPPGARILFGPAPPGMQGVQGMQGMQGMQMLRLPPRPPM